MNNITPITKNKPKPKVFSNNWFEEQMKSINATYLLINGIKPTRKEK